jgi:hypothetical protein
MKQKKTFVYSKQTPYFKKGSQIFKTKFGGIIEGGGSDEIQKECMITETLLKIKLIWK